MTLDLSVIIPVRDKDDERVQRAIDYVKNYVLEVIVVDYGSKVKPNLKDCKVIRYDKNSTWNKPHALNYGIKRSSGTFIMTMDADILIPSETIGCMGNYLRQDTFIYDINVKRIKVKDIGDWEKSWEWYEGKDNRHKINSKANGGIQVFSRKWIEKVKGYDEDLILFGGMDNDLWNRAFIDGLTMINLNKPIYHQEHISRKEDNLDPALRERAKFIRMEKSNYISNKCVDSSIIGNDPWGEEDPNQDKYLKLWLNWEEGFRELQEERNKALEEIRRTIMDNKLPIKSIDVAWQNG